MNTMDSTATTIPNGSGAAAMLAAAMGSFVLAILAFSGDKSLAIRNGLNFYKPTGPLSGVTTVAIVFWLLAWGFLERRWRHRSVEMRRINKVSLTLLAVSVLLTFPPIVDLL